jgi:maleylpyruvate isomerase
MSEPSNGYPVPAEAPESVRRAASPEPAHSASEDRLTEVQGLLAAATHRLLGDTISVTDEEWHAPSRLPGWSRGHVASHIARQADALGRLVAWARTGERQAMYTSDEQRDAEIEAGSGRSGLDLQIDLDTSAGRLAEAFDALDESGGWDSVVELRGGKQASARTLPLARLGEVVLHHIDLDIGYGVGDIEPSIAGWLLEWAAFRLAGRSDVPALRLETRSGVTTQVGPPGDAPQTIHGSAAELLGWLTGRSGPESVQGADGLVLPRY